MTFPPAKVHFHSKLKKLQHVSLAQGSEKGGVVNPNAAGSFSRAKLAPEDRKRVVARCCCLLVIVARALPVMIPTLEQFFFFFFALAPFLAVQNGPV